MRHLTIAALCGLVLAGLAQAEPLNYNVVNLQAEARREVPNDLMAVTMFTEQNDGDASRLSANLNKALTAAKVMADAYPKIKFYSGENQTYPVYDNKNRATGWRGRAEARLECRDFKQCAELIGKMQSVLQIGQWTFSISPERRRDVENELIGDALQAFNQRAEIVRASLKAKSVKVVNLNVNGGGGEPPPPVYAKRAMAMAMEAAPAPVAEGGTGAITVTVSGSVQLVE
ncbi:putative secreted protein [Chitinivorax tropicus]|uniref:Putative secreted protein n=1 Tax=Chitinivorax tropicus TaxID=714531 RepID=A0A840MK65_9PROT|nr:SIMPL domain-containing protein [Chitinivorax tropicus]MBB5017549.1 putative secreted protein [Chitinivorax tropicus]